MDNKKISEEKNAEEIIADEQLESVAGGTGSGYSIKLKPENNDAFQKLPISVQKTTSGPG